MVHFWVVSIHFWHFQVKTDFLVTITRAQFHFFLFLFLERAFQHFWVNADKVK